VEQHRGREGDPAVPEAVLKTSFLFQPPSARQTLPDTIYGETARYLSQALPDAVPCTFAGDGALVPFVKEHGIEVLVAEPGLTVQTALLLRGLDVVVIHIGRDPALAALVDIQIDPAAPPSLSGFTGPRYLLSRVLDRVSIDDLSALYGMAPARIREDVDSAEAETELLSIVRLFTRLEWDSEFFGVNVGYAGCLRMTPGIERLCRRFTQREKIDVMEYLCNCHDKLSVVTAEKAGYSFVDIRLTFETGLGHVAAPVAPRPNMALRPARLEDIPRLREIATGIYPDSRYYFDGNFDQEKIVEFYRNWVEKAVRGTFDDHALVLCEAENPVGYCSTNHHHGRAAKIGVFGLDERLRGTGAARYLLEAALWELKKSGREHVEVVTQGRNYAAQRLYQRAGFITQKTELWYHKWLH
jgi:dTDP-4-amino-4,6-dideoxy-D-galactose acyltransferase